MKVTQDVRYKVGPVRKTKCNVRKPWGQQTPDLLAKGVVVPLRATRFARVSKQGQMSAPTGGAHSHSTSVFRSAPVMVRKDRYAGKR